MSNSNVIYPRKWFAQETSHLDAPRHCLASTREILELLAAFSRIESPVFRGMIIKTAREAASACPPRQPPKSSA